MATVQISCTLPLPPCSSLSLLNLTTATRTTFLPGQLNVQATDPQTPFVTFDNGVKLILQTDGNIVVYDGKNTPLWASKSNVGNGDASKLALKFQSDGNLVEFYNGKPVWDSKTAGKGTKLVLLDAYPLLTILDTDGNVAWNSLQDKKR